MKTFNLLIGFVFVGFGFMAISQIPELTNYVGQELLATFLFYVICFILSLIAWILSYISIKDNKHLSHFNRQLAKYPEQKRDAQGRFIK
tara:strand:+ start:58 stop:324 length:267 start_codon:yes stop_codon:yes gene_type:complete